GLVIVSAAVAIVVNAYIAIALRGEASSLNVRAALLHVVGDLAASVAVVATGAIVLLTGWAYADPIASLVIAALIAFGAVRIVLDTVHILLEGVPKHLDLDGIRASIEERTGEGSVHDLHVWALAPEHAALSCHIVVGEAALSDGEHLVRGI